MNAVLGFELPGGLDTFPGGGNLDEDAVFVDTDGLVELDKVTGLFARVCAYRSSVKRDRQYESKGRSGIVSMMPVNIER